MTTCTVCELHAESVFRIEGMDCHRGSGHPAAAPHAPGRPRGARRRRRRAAAQREVRRSAADDRPHHRGGRRNRHARVARGGARRRPRLTAAGLPTRCSRCPAALVGVGLVLRIGSRPRLAQAAFAIAIVAGGDAHGAPGVAVGTRPSARHSGAHAGRRGRRRWRWASGPKRRRWSACSPWRSGWRAGRWRGRAERSGR